MKYATQISPLPNFRRLKKSKLFVNWTCFQHSYSGLVRYSVTHCIYWNIKALNGGDETRSGYVPYVSSFLVKLKYVHVPLCSSTCIYLYALYPALYLGGTPSQETGTIPLAVNSSRTVYIYANPSCTYQRTS